MKVQLITRVIGAGSSDYLKRAMHIDNQDVVVVLREAILQGKYDDDVSYVTGAQVHLKGKTLTVRPFGGKHGLAALSGPLDRRREKFPRVDDMFTDTTPFNTAWKLIMLLLNPTPVLSGV